MNNDHRRRAVRWGAGTPAAALALCLWLAPWAAHADAAGEALAHFNRGVELYRDGAFEGALAEFQRAYDAQPNYKQLYNIGRAAEELHDYARALDAFGHYMSAGGSEIAETRRAEVRAAITRLNARVARVRVATNAPAGSRVLVDDVVVGKIPLTQAVVVNLGTRRISIDADGRSATTTVTLSSEDDKLVEVRVESGAPITAPAPSNAFPAAPPAHASSPSSGPASFPWAPWVVTGALGVGAGVTGAIALGRYRDFEREQNTWGVTRQELTDAHDRVRPLATASDVLLGATVVSAAVATFFTVRYYNHKAAVGFAPGGASVSGSF